MGRQIVMRLNRRHMARSLPNRVRTTNAPEDVDRWLALSLAQVPRDVDGTSSPDAGDTVRDLLSALAATVVDGAARVPEVELPDRPADAAQAIDAFDRLEVGFLRRALDELDMEPAVRVRLGTVLDILWATRRRLVTDWFDGELERRNELLARAFHDLRSPLTSVLFLSDALQSGQAGASRNVQQRQIGLIYSAALTLHGLVEAVLAAHALEARGGAVEPVPFGLTSVVDGVRRTLLPLARMKGLELTVDVRCARSRLGDPDVLRRLLLNVVGNAIQNTDSGGVAVQFDDGLDGRLEVRVEDTGRGMDAGEVEELLDLLAAGSGRRRKGESESSIRGGLGLSICRQLCRLVGGRIGIDSEPGQGTCVRLELPFRESRSSSQLMNASV